MKSILKKLTVLSLLSFSIVTNAEETYSLGVGFGALYSGIGINISQLSKNEMKYFSAGCVSYSSVFGSACGVGIGWIKTDLFETVSNKHGFGGYVGVVGSENSYLNGNEAIYGVGVGYHYFFNGISNSGTNIGFSLVAGDTEDGLESGAMLQLGYQF